MKFPSLKHLGDKFRHVLQRFPVEMLFALLGTVAGIFLIESSYQNTELRNWCTRLLMTANLGLLLSLSATLFAESKSLRVQQKWGLRLLAFALAVVFLLIINPYRREADIIRFFLICFALHLLVSFAAFTAKNQLQGFWQFNKSLFLSFLTSVLYSAVLFAGLAAAIGAMNFLFNFKFEWDTFAILWACIAGLFNTAFFLSGVPLNLAALNADESYPKGLKIFTQYVLIPLATVYVIILLAYEIKILAEWNLPKGLVSNLILGYAVFGILALLLVYPVRNQEGNKWIRTYARSFYFLMLPLIVLLVLAVGTRIGKYGITEYRYFLILLAGWLLFITLYFLFSRRQSIKLIPVSLCVLTLLSVYGPQSAYNVTLYSQRHILLRIFTRNHALVNGKLMPVKKGKISRKDGNKAVAELLYIDRYYGMDALQPYLQPNLDTIKLKSQKTESAAPASEKYEWQQSRFDWVKDYLGLSSFSGYRYDDDEAEANTLAAIDKITNYYFNATGREIAHVKGYDYYLQSQYIGTDTATYDAGQLHIKEIRLGDGLNRLIINNDSTNFDQKALLKQLVARQKQLAVYRDTSKINLANNSYYKLPDAMLAIKKETAHYSITLQINSTEYNTDKEMHKGSYNFTEAAYLIKVK